jgi:hypothetical protein
MRFDRRFVVTADAPLVKPLQRKFARTTARRFCG